MYFRSNIFPLPFFHRRKLGISFKNQFQKAKSPRINNASFQLFSQRSEKFRGFRQLNRKKLNILSSLRKRVSSFAILMTGIGIATPFSKPLMKLKSAELTLSGQERVFIGVHKDEVKCFPSPTVPREVRAQCKQSILREDLK
ncbi:hypothetical protein CDAR_620461 [Caerostris darwini]|uniref:Uncharacterized protein n=1 Tax=Caerostris darwini TaxID=1538125 RepID=A0AAV4VUB3_9ARAC|nr:hypothetical protein CDAR_620461 [Caerostris darwini]